MRGPLFAHRKVQPVQDHASEGTGARGNEPLRTLATYRMSELGSVFGRNLIHDALGTVRVGDLVETKQR